VITDKTYELNYTNEGGFGHTIRLLKNIMGLWIQQECKRAWEKEGATDTFDQLEEAAEKAGRFKCFIDVDDDPFFKPGHMPEKVREYCRRTGQPVPETKGEIVRCVNESLAMRYRTAVEGLEEIVGKRLPVLHIVGGGSKNLILNQFAADALDRPVVTGPTEATSIGNIVSQLVALGAVKDLTEGRRVVMNSFPVAFFQPKAAAKWNEAYARYRRTIGK
jgi:rhamnulokinase